MEQFRWIDSKCCSFSFFSARPGGTVMWLGLSVSCERSGPNPAGRPLPVGAQPGLALPLPAPGWISPLPCPHTTSFPGASWAAPCSSGQSATPPMVSGPSLSRAAHRPTPPHRKCVAGQGLSSSFWPIDHSRALSRARKDFKEFSGISVTLTRMPFVGPPAGRQRP